LAQNQIEEKYHATVEKMNQTWLLVKQVQQTQEMMMSSMSKAIEQVMFHVCGKLTENLLLVVNKLETRIRNIELKDVTKLIHDQVSYMNEAYSEFQHHQEELKAISSKQNEAMATALDTLHNI